MFCSWFHVVVVVLCFYFYFKLFSFSLRFVRSHIRSISRCSVCALTPAIYLHAVVSVYMWIEFIHSCIRSRIRVFAFCLSISAHTHFRYTKNIQFIKFYFPPEITLTVFHSRVLCVCFDHSLFQGTYAIAHIFWWYYPSLGCSRFFSLPLLSRYICVSAGYICESVLLLLLFSVCVFLFLLIFIVIGWHNWTTLYKLVIALKALLLNATIWL